MFFKADRIVDRQRKYTEYFELDGRQFSVKVFYDLGGMSYFTGKVAKRGYFVSFTPCKYEKNGVGISFMLFHGYKEQVQDANRFSKKAFAQVRDAYFNAEDGTPEYAVMVELFEAVRRDFSE